MASRDPGERLVGFPKVRIRNLPEILSPPIPEGGARLTSNAGVMVQVTNGPEFRLLLHLEFLPDPQSPRGNHFHNHKTETLYVVSGLLRATYTDLDADQTATVILEPGDLVTVAPRCAHSYVALEHSFALEMTDSRYDPEDTLPFLIGQ